MTAPSKLAPSVREERTGRAPLLDAPAAIRVESLNVRYGQKAALRDVSLTLREGAITAMVGPSGCGKSSFLATLNRLSDLIPGCRVDGSIRFRDRDVRARETDVLDLRRRVGMIFQKPNPFPMSVRQNIALALSERRRLSRSEIDEIVEHVLQRVGLWDELRGRLDASALALSGGQQQRLCIARALALEPEVLLMDEPCSALDPLASATVEDLILELSEACTVVVVTHNLAQARRISDDLAFFWVRDDAGVLIESGSTRALFRAPRHELTRDYLSGIRG